MKENPDIQQKIDTANSQNVQIIQAGGDVHDQLADEKEPKQPFSKEPELRQAHVLFMDIVGYSKLKADQQAESIKTLNRIVTDCLPDESKLMMPTGDGMVIAFLENPESPLLVAKKIAPKVKDTEIPLRMGIHTGPVYLVEDINKQKNIVGGGINLAQRVMDCGEAGHILASKVIASALSEVKKEYDSLFHYLGKFEVKHGLVLEIYNVYGEDFGNSKLPSKIKIDNPNLPPEIKRDKIGKTLGTILVGVIITVIGGLILLFLEPKFKQQQIGEKMPISNKETITAPKEKIPPKERKPTIAIPSQITQKVRNTPQATITVTVSAPKKRMTVLPFDNFTGDNNLGKEIAGLITTELRDYGVASCTLRRIPKASSIVSGYPYFAIAQGYDKYNNPLPCLTYKWYEIKNYPGRTEFKEGISPADVDVFAQRSGNLSACDWIIKYGFESGTVTYNGLDYSLEQLKFEGLELKQLIDLAIGDGAGVTYIGYGAAETDTDISMFGIVVSDENIEKRFTLIEGSVLDDDIVICGQYGRCKEGIYVTAGVRKGDRIIFGSGIKKIKGTEEEVKKKIPEEVIKTINKLLSEGKI
ncbi:MAG: adenylate/guanylate cyclase domain-containing protein [bacterium]